MEEGERIPRNSSVEEHTPPSTVASMMEETMTGRERESQKRREASAKRLAEKRKEKAEKEKAAKQRVEHAKAEKRKEKAEKEKAAKEVYMQVEHAKAHQIAECVEVMEHREKELATQEETRRNNVASRIESMAQAKAQEARIAQENVERRDRERASQQEVMNSASQERAEERARRTQHEVERAQPSADPGIDMVRQPTKADLLAFERNPETSVLMLHDLFGDDRLLEPPKANMSAEEEESFKAYCLDRCKVSEADIQNVIDKWKASTGHRCARVYNNKKYIWYICVCTTRSMHASY